MAEEAYCGSSIAPQSNTPESDISEQLDLVRSETQLLKESGLTACSSETLDCIELANATVYNLAENVSTLKPEIHERTQVPVSYM